MLKNKSNNAKSTIIVCLTGAVMLMGVLTGIMVIESGSAESGGAPVAKGLTVHDPIYINANANFTAANGVTNGSGTAADPYIIENWDINAGTASSPCEGGIHIKDTDVYFIIRNCVIHDGKINTKKGVCLEWVSNGAIYNTTSYSNEEGVYLFHFSNGDVADCTFHSNSANGIWIDYSSGNFIDNCNVYSNPIYGIHFNAYLDPSLTSDNTVTNCAVYNNYYGIYLGCSSSNDIIDCAVYDNSQCGVWLDDSSNSNSIYHNSFINNGVNAHDPFTNCWNDSSNGNYWDDYNGIDANGDGIGDTPYDIPDGSNQDNYPLMHRFHSPIYINGNAQFTSANGVSSGSGTAADPYIIENWDINASSANGIDVRNTDAYFTIRNCELHDGGSTYHGIYFSNVTNGKIQNITAYNCHHGIYLITSSNNTISVCNIYKDTMGIELYSNSNDNIISGCDIHDTGPGGPNDGIQIYENSERNIIRDCTIYNHDYDGITLSSTSNNEIINCTIYNCTSQGIYLSDSSDNSIINCTINDTSSDGIYLYGSSNNQITNCTITNSGGYDFYFYTNSYITALNTTFTKTKVYFGDASSTLTVKYYLHTKVINSTNKPIQGTTVRIKDNTNGTFDQNYTTGSDGWVRWIECTEYWQNQTTKIYYTPHNIASSKTGYTANYTEASMGESKEVVVVLSEVGLIGCWHFDGDGKNECNGPNATTVGSAYFNSTGGKLGGYAYMNSSADYIKIPYDSMFDLPDNFTIEFWFRQRENRSFLQDLIYKGSATNNYNFRIFRQLWNEYNYGPIIAGFTSSATGYWNQVSNPNQLTHNVWHYVTYTKNTSVHAYYLDGVLIHSSSTTDPAVTPPYDIIIGDSAVDTDIDEVRIYNKALNASEVLAHYQEYAVNNPPNPPTLILPSNNTWTNDNIPLFDWVFSDPDAGGTQGGFHVQVDNASDFSSVNYEYNGSTNITTYWQFPEGTGYTTIPDGIWYWRVKTKDNNGTWGGWSGWNVTKIDTTPPTLNSIVIGDTDTGNTAWTNSLTVTLWVSATDTYSGMGTGGGMCFKNEAAGAWSAWETYSSSKTWNLASGPDGTRTVYFKAKDAAGNENTSAINDTIILDTLAPYPHDPIYINGNSNFTSANGVSSGNGTAGNPYIIENWDINASSADGIYIQNTNAYFIIRNCVIHDGKSNNKNGIYLYNATNSKIENVTSYNHWIGMFLYSSLNNAVTNCTVYNSSQYGFSVSSSSGNTISSCAVYGNDYGIYLSASSNNNVTNCNSYNNTRGFYLYGSSGNSISSCNVYNNSNDGIRLSSSPENAISSNSIHSNGYDGIALYSSSNSNTIIGNSIYSNVCNGIRAASTSNNNQITGNSIYSNNNHGIEVSLNSGTTISDSTIYSNSGYGTNLYGSESNITNCTVTSNLKDFALNSDAHTTLLNTTFTTTYFTDSLSSITVKYYLHVRVLNSTSSPISGATVRIRDNVNGTFDQNYTTGSDGWVRWIECTEYWQNQTSTIYYTPHNVSANKTGYVTNYSEVNMDSSKEITITLSAAGGLTPHDPIYINGNSQFTSANGVTSGNGTVSNPYIIENWDINASTAHGIRIENTDAYFIIRNCTIHDGGNSYSGIYFYNVKNGKIDNVTSYNNYDGIYLGSSSNNNISANQIYDNYNIGIQLYWYSSNNNISTCQIYYNNSWGICLAYSSNNNTISACQIYNNSQIGIYLQESSNNEITSNQIYNNSYGIWLCYASNNNYISANQIYNNSNYGIYLYSSSVQPSSNNNIIGNTFTNDGVFIRGDTLAGYIQNIDVSNTVNGKPLYYYKNQSSLVIDNIPVGQLILINCSNCDIKNINIIDTDVGIELVYSSNNTVTNCTISNSGSYDIYLNGSSSATALNTTFGKNKVYLDANSSFTVKYYLHVKVLNSTSSPIPGATVRVRDNANGTFDQNYTTGSDGWVRWIECTEYWQSNNTTTIYYTPHNVSANKTGYVTNYSEVNMDSSKEITITLSASGGLTPHDPIYINGNSNFTAANGVSSGSGTESDPYIIENWDINASSANGIHIENTDAYFIIRNCISHDGKSNSKNGIYFYNVQNGKIDNVTSYNNYYGIWLDCSTNNTITNCKIYNNSYYYGIILSSSSNNNISANHIYNNSYDGIMLSSSSNNNISANHIYNNSRYGIYLHESSNNNIISANQIYNNSYGILLSPSPNNNIISANQIYNNSNYGIYLYSSSNNTVTNCNVYNNSDNGIYLGSSSNNTISNCVVYNNNVGIFLDSSSNNNSISNCAVYNNTHGICLWSSSNNNQIISSTITNSGIYDFYLDVSSSATALNTTFDKTKVYFGDATSSLTVKYYLHVKVINSTSTPISGATVRVQDNVNGTFDQNYTTGSDGWVRWIECTEYMQTQSGKTYYTPHNVTTNKTGYITNYSEVNIDSSKEIIITLSTAGANNPPTLSNSAVNPTSGTTATTFTYNVTYSDADGDSPTSIVVYILKGGANIVGSPFAMTWQLGSNTTGANYIYSTTLTTAGTDYTFYFNATDGTDNATPTASTDAPDVSSANQPPNPPTLVAPANNTWTNDNTPYFDWEFSDPDAGDTQNAFNVTISKNSDFSTLDYWANMTDSNTYFNWPLLWSTLSDGTWYWRVKTKDNNGAWGGWSDVWVLKIDTTNPIAGFPTNGIQGNWGTVVSGVYYTNSTWVVLRPSAYDPGTVVSGLWKFQISNDGVNWYGYNAANVWTLGGYVNWTANATAYNWNLTAEAVPGNYNKTVYFRVFDNASNYATTSKWIILDTYLPTSTVTVSPGITYDDVVIMNTTTFNVAWDGSDISNGLNGSGIYYFVVQYNYSDDGGVTWTGWMWNLTVASPGTQLFSGVNGRIYHFRCRATDRVGWEGDYSSVVTVKIDTTSPSVTSTTPLNNTVDISIGQSIIIQFSEEMNTSSVQYTCLPNPNGWSASWNATSSKLTLSHNAFAQGTTYIFNVTGKDLAGNDLAFEWYVFEFATGTGLFAVVTTPNGGEIWVGGTIHCINYTISGGTAPYNTTLYYSTDGGATYPNIISITTQSAEGTYIYAWITPGIDASFVKVKAEVTDGAAQTATDTSDNVFTIDSTPPTSCINPLPTYWNVTLYNYYSGCIFLEWTHSEGSEPVTFKIFYKISTSDWYEWTLLDNTTTCTNFTALTEGETYYFYSVATDAAGNVETDYNLTTGDTHTTVDTSFPYSSANPISPYWHTTLPFTITATTVDINSGVSNVTLWYRYSTDNSTWSNWTLFDTDTVAPWSWNFTAPNGNGYYEFYSIAVDNAGNTEGAPAAADAVCGVNVADIVEPEISNVQATPDPQTSGGHVNITCTVTDNVGVSMVMVNITGPAGFTPWNVIVPNIAGTSIYYYNAAYTIIGTYSYYIWANDTSGNENISATYSFNITALPENSWIKGCVFDNSTWMPVAGANVSVNKTGYHNYTFTDVTGYFEMRMIAGTFNLTVSAEGYHDYYEMFTISEYETVYYNISLEHIIVPPANLSVIINNNAVYTNSTSVTLTLYAENATEMCFKNETGGTWSSWETYSSSKTWNLASGPDGTRTVYFKCRNSAGESEIVNDSIVLDTTAPTTTYIVDGTMGGNNWYVSEVSITLTATDTGSGVSKIEYNIGAGWIVYTGAFNLTDGNHTLQYRAADTAGNVETAKSEIIKVDTTPPTPDFKINDGDAYTNTEYVTLTVTGEDTSGLWKMCFKNELTGTWSDWVDYAEGPIAWSLVSGDDGLRTVYFKVRDYAGWESSTTSDTITLDKTPPTTTDDAPYGWQTTSPIVVTLTATDATSGVAHVYHKKWFITETEPTTYTEGTTVTISTDGKWYVKYYSVDNAGNSEIPKTVEVWLDATPPTTIDDAPTGWENQLPNIINLTSVDITSGVVHTYYKVWLMGTTEPTSYTEGTTVIINSDGKWYIKYYSVDNASNVETAKTIEIWKDTTSPPTPFLTSPENKDVVLTSTPAFAWSSVADELSGLACYEIQVDDNIDFLSLKWSASPTINTTTSLALPDGTYYWRVRAVDNAGNFGDWSVVWNFTIITENQAPVIEIWNPTSDPTINETETITFNIVASDINEDNLTYMWYVDGELTGETGTAYTFVSNYGSAGTYNVNVTVSDGVYYDYYEWTLAVINVNRPPFIQSYNPASDPTINETEYIELKINASDFDAGDTLTLQWYLNEALVDTYGSYTFVSNYDSAGIYLVKVTVSDGEYNVSHEWTITVINVNRVPVIESFSPKIYSTINETESQTFTVNASDPDGNSIGYAWYLNNTVVAGETDSSYVFTSTYGSSGVYNITVVITDNGTPMLSVNHTWALWVSNVNVPPVADFVYYEGIQVADGDYVNITLRVSGKKWQILNMTVYADTETMGFLSIVREPGSPDNQSQSLEIMIDSSKQYTTILNYTSNGNGASPTWLTINYKNISNKMHLVFNANKNETQTRMFNLTEILDIMIRSSCLIKFESTSCDPDGDDITTYEWLFDDGNTSTGIVVYHYYTTGNHTAGLTVTDSNDASDTVYRNITVLDAVEYYSSYRGLVGVELDCPADLLIVDKYNPEKVIGFTESGEIVNLVPNATVIVCGDVEIYILPKNTDYDYTVSGVGPGEYKFTVFSPGEYGPGEYSPGEYGPGEYSPGEYSPGEYSPGEYTGKTYCFESNTSTVTADIFTISMDAGTVKITSNTEKYYSMIIMNGTNKFTVEEMSIGSGATHSYAVDDWNKLETNATSVKLSIDENNDGIIDRSFDLSTGSAGKDLLKPDLSITKITCSNEQPTEGEQVLFYVTIQNIGWGPAHDIDVSLYVDDVLVDSTSIAVIWTDRTAVATLLWVAKAGNHSFRIVLDADGTVNELNENNNEHMDSISAEGKPSTAFDFTLILISAVIVIAVVCAAIGVGLIKKRKTSVMAPSKRVTVRCPKCGETIDVTGLERPTEVICPKCGSKGALK